MPTVQEVVRRLLPNGTAGPGDWSKAPQWPPDVFAVAATLANASGCYSDAAFTAGLLDTGFFSEDYRTTVHGLGVDWSLGTFPAAVDELWAKLVACTDEVGGVPENGGCDWWRTALHLVSLSDEAAMGFGFKNSAKYVMAHAVFQQLINIDTRSNEPKNDRAARKQGDWYVPDLPNTLCIGVPVSEACVQPKTRTPQVGCTLRSFTHNLALLPPAGEVRTYWRYADVAPDTLDKPLNLLIVPFPFEIKPTCFRGTTATFEHPYLKMGFFDIEQKWLRGVTAEELDDFISALIEDAKSEIEEVHGVVFPEASLSYELAEKLAGLLTKHKHLEMFLAGVIHDKGGGTPRSQTFCRLFPEKGPFVPWAQSKHHRWKLDARQLKNYDLAHILSPDHVWWEKIDVSKRECYFHVFRGGASLAVLICEDLARIDPVQTVLRAIGPNLVIALLMDGPQWERRWPGRYATVLADDPGSAVLTLSSLGLMRRAAKPDRHIALWKDPLGEAEQIELPLKKQGVVLSIRTSREEHVASDWRSDGNASRKLSLAKQFPVGVDLEKFSWLNAD
jgi:hypothetical protein